MSRSETQNPSFNRARRIFWRSEAGISNSHIRSVESIGVVELETMRGKGERFTREIVERGLEERSGEGTNNPNEGGLGESCG